MKKIITILTIICSLLIMKNVSAGTLSWKNFKRLSPNTFEFYLEAEDLKLNYLSGEWNVENGHIVEITMNDGWINTTGNNNKFYYYHNGIKSGNYRIATIKIELIKDGTTKIQNLQMDSHTCTKDHLNNYFDPNGTITNENNYKKLCFNNDNTLRNLIISNGTLSPAFQSNIEFYQTTVEHNTNKIIFTPLLSNTKSKIISDNTCHLNIGQNNCKIIIEAENGDQKTYTIEVTRKEEIKNPTLSDNATLKSLTISNGILSPSFDSNIFSYTTKVENDINSITWEAIPNHSKANVLTTYCALEVGENTCEIIVEAENKTKKTYYLFVTREKKIDTDKDNDTTIKDLTIQNGTLLTEFNSNTKEYNIKVKENTKTIIFQYTMNANNQKYTVSHQIDPNKPYYDLTITSLNNQKKDTYRFNFKFIKDENTNSGTDSKPEDNNNQTKPNIKNDNDFEIENPQTGISLDFKAIISLTILMIVGIICFKKKNKITKI